MESHVKKNVKTSSTADTNRVLVGTNRRNRKLVPFLAFILIVFVVAALSSLTASNAQEVYGALNLPAFAPPSWLFGPMWSLMYLLIAVAAWLIYRARGFSRPLYIWGVQIVLNLFWTPLFFGIELYWIAFIDIISLGVSIVWCIVAFWPVRKLASVLMMPYLAWITFAATLNIGIIILN